MANSRWGSSPLDRLEKFEKKKTMLKSPSQCLFLWRSFANKKWLQTVHKGILFLFFWKERPQIATFRRKRKPKKKKK